MRFKSVQDSPFSEGDRVERGEGRQTPQERTSDDPAPVAGQSVTFEVPGRPHGKRRPKLAVGDDGKPHSYEHPDTKQYEQKVGHCARKARPERWPKEASYRLSVQAFYPDRKVADLDNILKAIWDGCEGVLYDNDRQVCEIGKCKREGRIEGVDEGCVKVEVQVVEGGIMIFCDNVTPPKPDDDKRVLSYREPMDIAFSDHVGEGLTVVRVEVVG